jgi:UPF0755 protein
MLNWLRRIFIIFIIAIIGIWLLYTYQITTPVSSDQSIKTIEIKQGNGASQIGQLLVDQGLIRSRWFFELYVKLNKLQHNFNPGKIKISPSMNFRQIVSLLTTQAEKTVRIQEGWNNQQIGDILEKANLVKKADFIKYISSDFSGLKERYSFLKDLPESASLEGYLFPDTYNFFNNSSNEQIVRKLLNNFDYRVDMNLRQEAERQGMRLYDVITLASIIEKEVRWKTDVNYNDKNYEDMKMVADIFLKRLKENMPLQSDATINYLTNKGNDQPSFEDLKTISLYNTYLNKGLPPGPIDNPSLYAIKAVINPTPNSYYYFLTTKEGRVIYSKTYQEHLQNKKKYLDSQK